MWESSDGYQWLVAWVLYACVLIYSTPWILPFTLLQPFPDKCRRERSVMPQATNLNDGSSTA